MLSCIEKAGVRGEEEPWGSTAASPPLQGLQLRLSREMSTISHTGDNSQVQNRHWGLVPKGKTCLWMQGLL